MSDKYERKLHMSSCPACKEDALNVYLYRRAGSTEPFRCITCVWVVDPDADLEHTYEVPND